MTDSTATCPHPTTRVEWEVWVRATSTPYGLEDVPPHTGSIHVTCDVCGEYAHASTFVELPGWAASHARAVKVAWMLEDDR